MQGDQCRSDDLPERVPIDVRAMHQDRQGRFWIGGQWGLVVGEDTGNARTWTRVESADGLPRSYTSRPTASQAQPSR